MDSTHSRGSAFGGAFLLVIVVLLITVTLLFFFGDVSFASGQAKQTEKPDPSLSFNYTNSETDHDRLAIQHVEGPRVNPGQLSVSLAGGSCTGAGDPNGRYTATDDFGLDRTNWLSPGMTLFVDGSNPTQLCRDGTLELDSATVTVEWKSPDGEYKTIERWTP